MNSKDLLFKKQSNYILFWIVISALLLFLLLFSSFYKYKPYYVTTGIYDKEAQNVVILLENNKLHYINDTKIKVNKVSVDKKSVLVGEYISVDNKIYNQIFIKISNLDMEQSVITVTFELPETTILKRLWKGLIE